MKAGVDIVRYNFSHAKKAEYQKYFQKIKKVSPSTKLMIDLQGPRIRIGRLKGKRRLLAGQTAIFDTGKGQNSKSVIPLTENPLDHELAIGDPFLIANGTIETEVLSLKPDEIRVKVITGGTIRQGKSVNAPGVNISLPSLTEKDKADLEFGLKIGVDWIALSFVQAAQDILELRRLIGDQETKIIAKIERQPAIKNIDEILKAADGIMIARGDLGIETPIEELPFLQRDLIKKAKNHGKPSIVATQFLASMVDHNRPSRAEVSDIASAVLEGADGLMLSDETAIGQFPVEALLILKKVILRAEKEIGK